MTNKKKILKIVYIIVQILGIAFTVFFFAFNRSADADYSIDDNSIYNWSDGWTVSYENVMEQDVSFPSSFDVERGNTLIIRKTLPNKIKKYNCVLLQSNRQDISVNIDGVLRKSYSDKETRKVGKSSPSAYVIVPLYGSDEGKDISILISSETKFSGYMDSIYLGNEMTIMLTIIRQNAFWIFVDAALIILSIICLSSYLAYRNGFERANSFKNLFWMALLTGFWAFTQLGIRQLFFGDIAFLENLGLFIFAMMPFPIVGYMAEALNAKRKIVYKFLYVVIVINFFMSILLHITGRVSLYEYQPVLHIVLLAAIIIVSLIVFIDIKEQMAANIKYVIMGMLPVYAGLIMEVISANAHDNHHPGGYYALGTLISLLINFAEASKAVSIEQQRKQDAENANMAKSRFLATMSHEIRTPINSVLGMNEMILRDSKDPVILGYAQNILSAGNMLLGLINDILDFSKIESGKMELIVGDYDSKSLFTDLYNLIEKRARQKGLELEINVDSAMPQTLRGDMNRIRQVITNILTNAVKYTAEGKVTLDARMIEVDNEAILKISVKDTGQGIKSEDIDKLFTSFTRLNEQKNKSIEGTGLGLSITKQLVTMMDGDITVTSEFGKGSDFVIAIPQKIVDPAPIGEFDPVASNGSVGSKEKKEITFTCPENKILIVDDNKVNLVVASGLLKPTQVQITTAGSGDAAIALCKENKYDLIFMDHMMPGKDGIETMHELKEIFGNEWNTPIVVLTANAIEGMREMYMGEGFDDYLTKPMTALQLEEMLIKYIKK